MTISVSLPLARRGSHPGRRSSKRASVPPRYRRFFTPTDPAATLWPSTPLPAPTLLRGLSPRGQQGFTSSNANFAACCRPYPAGIGCGCQPAFFRRRCCLHHGSSGSASGPTLTRLAQRSMPAARSVAPRPEGRVRQEAPRRAFATPTRLLSFTAPWPLPCRDFHSLGCTAFLLVTPNRMVRDRRWARGSRDSAWPYDRLWASYTPSLGSTRWAGWSTSKPSNATTPIGTGVTEAAAKTIVGTRMKRASARFSQHGGQTVLLFRSSILSHRFDALHEKSLSRPTRNACKMLLEHPRAGYAPYPSKCLHPNRLHVV